MIMPSGTRHVLLGEQRGDKKCEGAPALISHVAADKDEHEQSKQLEQR